MFIFETTFGDSSSYQSCRKRKNSLSLGRSKNEIKRVECKNGTRMRLKGYRNVMKKGVRMRLKGGKNGI